MIRNLSICFALVASFVAFAAGAFPSSAHATLPDTVMIRVEGGGRVVATPDRVCTSECTFTYGEDSTAIVNVAAAASPGWKFSRWGYYYDDDWTTRGVLRLNDPGLPSQLRTHGRHYARLLQSCVRSRGAARVNRAIRVDEHRPER